MFLAGLRHEIDAYMDWLHIDPRFADIVAKESFSDRQPFTKLLVKLKPEIITMRMPLIKPEDGRAPFVEAKTLKPWLDQGHDDMASMLSWSIRVMILKWVSAALTTPSITGSPNSPNFRP